MHAKSRRFVIGNQRIGMLHELNLRKPQIVFEPHKRCGSTAGPPIQVAPGFAWREQAHRSLCSKHGAHRKYEAATVSAQGHRVSGAIIGRASGKDRAVRDNFANCPACQQGSARGRTSAGMSTYPRAASARTVASRGVNSSAPLLLMTSLCTKITRPRCVAAPSPLIWPSG